MITITSTVKRLHPRLIDGKEYRRVHLIDPKNRYIDMKKWGFDTDIGWIETSTICMDDYVPTEMVKKWSNAWEKELGLQIWDIGKPFIYTQKFKAVRSLQSTDLTDMFTDLISNVSPVIRTARCKAVEYKDGILIPSTIMPDEVFRPFDFVGGLPFDSHILDKDGLFRPYLHPYELCNVNVENLIDSEGFVTFTVGFESNEQRLKLAHKQVK